MPPAGKHASAKRQSRDDLQRGIPSVYVFLIFPQSYDIIFCVCLYNIAEFCHVCVKGREPRMVKNRSLFLRALVFLLILLTVIYSIQGLFSNGVRRMYINERGFALEKHGSLDGVYVGGSDVHFFWQPLFGWSDHGIAVWNLSVDALSMRAIKYLVMEAHRCQPDALIIINLNLFKKDLKPINQEDIHRVADYMPLSLNKVRFINSVVEGTEFQGLKKLEFFFPIIRFHSRWDELPSWAYDRSPNEIRSSMQTSTFERSVEDLSEKYKPTDGRGDLPDNVEAILLDLLDYCDSENLNVLFVKLPQAYSEMMLARMNTAEALVLERGYPCIDVIKAMDDIGLRVDTDYIDHAHTNVHGSLKYSAFLGDYLVEHYGFTDKRGAAGWEGWDESAAEYYEYLGPYALPFELLHAPRDYSLSIPALNKPSVDGRNVTVSWTGSDGAEGYEIYRKSANDENGFWHLIADVDASILTYSDEALEAATAYTYTVVPYRVENGAPLYGCFNVLGIKATTGED